MIIEEGFAKFEAPYVNEKGPGKVRDVFYNRAMVFNRDTTIFLLYNIRMRDALDGLAATGIRGIRIAKEIGIKTTINDKNPRAVETIRKNVVMNHVDARVTMRDVNALLAEEKFDYVDIDPFGSPAPFVDMAIRSARVLGVTATDTATLGGRNRRIVRRYLANVHAPTYLIHEVGIRVLLGYVGRMAVRFDFGIEPLLSVWHGHFYRVYVTLKRGVSHARRTLEKIGQTKYGGPMWLSQIHDFEILLRAKIPEYIPTRNLMEKYLNLWTNEKHLFFYHLPTLASELHVSTPPIYMVIKKLKEMGYQSSRTQFSAEGVKTDAEVEVIKKCVLDLLNSY